VSKRKPLQFVQRDETKEAKARRASEENPIFERGEPLRPEGLSPRIRKRWNICATNLLGKGLLARTDGVQLLAMVNAWIDGNDVEAFRLMKEFEARGVVPKTTVIESLASSLAIPAPTINITKVAKQYASAVTSGEIIAGVLVKKAAERFTNDLNVFAFDESAARHCGDYIARLGMSLLPWECFLLANLFGFKRENGTRRFQLAHIEVAKKNGKSSLMSALALYMTDPAGDGEPLAESYAAATTKYQSQDITFKIALRLRAGNKEVAERSTAFKASIRFGDSNFAPLAANAERLQGKNISFGILDELGDHPTPDLYQTFTTSTAARKQPLVISISTAGSAREGNICWGVREHAMQVLDKTINDDSFFCFIATLDEEDKWNDEKVWIKANPSLGVLVQLDNLKQMSQRAKSLPSGKLSFCRFNLNIWPSTSFAHWIDADALARKGCAYVLESERKLPVTERLAAVEKRLNGHRCWGGLDLALVNDLSALCLFFPPYILRESSDYEETDEPFVVDGVFECLFRIWCPEENISKRSKEHRVPYEQWREEGLLIATPGEVVDFDFIEKDILELRDRFSIRELGFDIALARDFAGKLERGHGMRMTQCRQGFALSPSIYRTEKLITEAKLCTHQHPIANWCLSNVVLSLGVRDARFEKAKAREKIDAAVAIANAIDVWLAFEQGNQSIYNSRGIVTL
jgi:phage terminase large subunit-like protein